jgi:hypothetical protein
MMAKNPTEVVPVYIRDFLGDYTNVSGGVIRIIYQEFRKADKETYLIDLDENTIIISLHNYKDVGDILKEINFEGAMKILPTNRIIKIYLTLHDPNTEIQFVTNGIRMMVDRDTNFTETVESYISQAHPKVEDLKLVKIKIRGGVEALTADDHMPYWPKSKFFSDYYQDNTSDEDSSDTEKDEL